MAASLLVYVPHELHEQKPEALSILKQVGTLNPDDIEVRAIKNVVEAPLWITLAAKRFVSLSAAKVARKEMAQEAGSYKPALLNWEYL